MNVSVVIPCHNYGRFLASCIRSVLRQSVRPTEILVVDDASTDDTQAVAGRFASQGINYLRVDHRHVHLARSAGFRATTGDALVFLDADDWLPRTYIEDSLPLFSDGSSGDSGSDSGHTGRVGIVYSDMICFGDTDDVWCQPEFSAERLEQTNFIGAGSLVLREALERSGAMDRMSPDQCFADWWLWRQVVAAGYTAAKQSKSSYYYRIHSDSMMSQYLASKVN